MQTVQKIVGWLEIAMVAILVLGLILKFMGVAQSSEVMTIGFLSISMFYCLALPILAWQEGQKIPLIIVAALSGLSFLVPIMGVLFYLQKWPYGYEMVISGSLGSLMNPFYVVAPVICLVFAKYDNNQHYFKTVFSRIAFSMLFWIFCAVMYAKGRPDHYKLPNLPETQDTTIVQ